MPYSSSMKSIVEMVGLTIYEEAGCSTWAPPRHGAAELACGVFGSGVLRFQPHAFAESTTATVHGKREIVIRSELPIERANFAIGQQLAHLWLEGESWYEGMGAASQRTLDQRIGAWLVAPLSAVQAFVDESGPNISALAKWCTITETCATRVLFEAGCQESVITTPNTIYRCGELLRGFSDVDVRHLATATRTPRSLRKVVLADEPGRVALFARAG